MSNQLLQLEGISDEKAALLIDHFTGFYDVAADWKAKAEAIKVTSTDQVAEMKMARTGRLFLKDKRVAIENLRKKLKEESLREGQAIDRVARELKGLIEPIEGYLETQEKYAEIKEAERLQTLRNIRTPVLLELGYQLSAGDPSSYTEEEYIQLIDSLKAVKAAREEAERAEQERQERERRELAAKQEAERKELAELRAKQAEAEKELRDAEAKQKELERLLTEANNREQELEQELENELERQKELRDVDKLAKEIEGHAGDAMAIEFGLDPGVSFHDPNNPQPDSIPRSKTHRLYKIRTILESLRNMDGIDGEACFENGSHQSSIQGMIDRLERPTLEKLIISIEI